MKRTLTALATVAALMTGTVEAGAKEWFYSVIDTKDGKLHMVQDAQSTCSYHSSIKAARTLAGDDKAKYFNVWAEDNEAKCPRVSRAAKKAMVEGQKAE